MARFASLSVLALVALLAGSALALPYNVEMAQAQAALKANPKYKLFGANMKNITVYARQYSATYRNPAVTLFAPNDAAVTSVLTKIVPTKAYLTKLIGQHIVRGSYKLKALAALPPGTKLVTFTPGKIISKISAVNKFPILLKGVRPTITALEIKPIYQGQWISIYGASKVLPL